MSIAKMSSRDVLRLLASETSAPGSSAYEYAEALAAALQRAEKAEAKVSELKREVLSMLGELSAMLFAGGLISKSQMSVLMKKIASE